jgi:4-hydroxybenzoate polyprenyltransferase
LYTAAFFLKVSLQNNIHGRYFILVVCSYLLIAAAGYIINDYFDLNIDQVNKPGKVIVSVFISRRWSLLWHILLSLLAIIFCIYIDIHTHSRFATVTAVTCVFFLFFYSSTFKKKLLLGNVLVSVITASSILALLLFETNWLLDKNRMPEADKLIRITILYTGFAFIISLIREMVKDMEDVEGDRKYGASTMPIVWGINASKVFVSVWLIVLITTLSIIQVYVLQFGWFLSAVYSAVFIIVPLIWILRKLFTAYTSKNFHQLSTVIKWVMFTGILSMLFFVFYR